MSHKGYEPDATVLVLSADSVAYATSPKARLNHVALTRIHGNGRVVFIDPEKGSSEIFEGQLDPHALAALFELLQAKGFFGFADSYIRPGWLGGTADIVTATRRGEPEKRVTCVRGAPSAPPTFQDCYQALRYPHIRPSQVKSYVRQPITAEELAAGWYYGFEYQKKLDTPHDWIWTEAGRSSKWSKPPAVTHAVNFDSGFMIPQVNGCHHIRVHYSGDPATTAGTVQFDANLMSPNEFGDIGMTTLMYFAPRPATFTLLEAKSDRSLFSVSVPGYTKPKLRLVVLGDPANPTGGRLLTLDTHDAIQNIYSLQRLPAP